MTLRLVNFPLYWILASIDMAQTSDESLRFVRPGWRSLHRVARRSVAREEDMRDLVQETLPRAWRNFSPTDTRNYNQAWLHVIMRSAATDWQPAANRRVRLVPTEGAELTEHRPNGTIDMPLRDRDAGDKGHEHRCQPDRDRRPQQIHLSCLPNGPFAREAYLIRPTAKATVSPAVAFQVA